MNGSQKHESEEKLMATFVIHADKAKDLDIRNRKTGYTYRISDLSETLYVTQVSDLREIYESRFGEDAWFSLDPNVKTNLIRAASSHIRELNDGMYSWHDAITDSMSEVLGDLPDELEF